jgi:hypothetical protein
MRRFRHNARPQVMRIVWAFFLAASVMAPSAGQPRPATIVAGGAWAAIDRGDSCLALSRSLRVAAKGKVQATAGFAFSADRRRWGEFHARLSHIPRPGSSVMLVVANQPFLLVVRDGFAWSRGPLQEQAIIAASRSAAGMRVEGRDLSGRRFADLYSLDGAPTAIDAAAARCSVRGAGKMPSR